jgi:hypothetical protein
MRGSSSALLHSSAEPQAQFWGDGEQAVDGDAPAACLERLVSAALASAASGGGNLSAAVQPAGGPAGGVAVAAEPGGVAAATALSGLEGPSLAASAETTSAGCAPTTLDRSPTAARRAGARWGGAAARQSAAARPPAAAALVDAAEGASASGADSWSCAAAESDAFLLPGAHRSLLVDPIAVARFIMEQQQCSNEQQQRQQQQQQPAGGLRQQGGERQATSNTAADGAGMESAAAAASSRSIRGGCEAASHGMHHGPVQQQRRWLLQEIRSWRVSRAALLQLPC